MEFLQESRNNEGVTEVKQQATEHQPLMVQVGGVWTRVDVAHRDLRQKKKEKKKRQTSLITVRKSETNITSLPFRFEITERKHYDSLTVPAGSS